VLLIAWEIVGRRANKALFAPPTAVLGAANEMIASGELWRYLSGSLQVLAIGFGLALVIGIPLGVAIARSRILNFALDWYVDAFNSTPNVALVPLMTLIFGFDVTAKVSWSCSRPCSPSSSILSKACSTWTAACWRSPNRFGPASASCGAT
jgi:NitT/TauT family transport system permease protein